MSENEFIAQVKSVIFFNPQNGFHVLGVVDRDKKHHNITAYGDKIYQGVSYKFFGEWAQHKTYGLQFQSKNHIESTPTKKEGVMSYLSSELFKGIGPIRAKKIVDKFGETTIDILNNDITRLKEVKGISKKIINEITESWKKHSEVNDIMVFLKTFGLSNFLADKILKHYGSNCVEKIKENPYELTKFVTGIGFHKADRIALSLGVDRESDFRIESALQHILVDIEKIGHCYIVLLDLIEKTKELLEIDSSDTIKNVISKLEKSYKIKTLVVDDEKRFYNKRSFYDETFVYERIKLFSKQEENISKYDKKHINKTLDSTTLSESQKNAIKNIVAKKVSVLTGNPGTGKTFCTKTLVNILIDLGHKIELCAPTGRAAKRMEELIGKEAKTIHRLLGWNPEIENFNEEQVDASFIVVDESSMLDIHLASALLKATKKEGCQILFVGDVDQLPPVGAGNFFKDIIDSGVVSVYRLKEIFRQAAESKIIMNAHQINQGIVPFIDNPIEEPEVWKKGVDCVFIESGFKKYEGQKFAKTSSLHYGLDLVDMILKIYTETIPKYFKTNEDVQILVPIKKSHVGTIDLNKKLQNSLNPKVKGLAEIQVDGTYFRVGDKVIQTSNNYTLNVFNGDIGRIVSMNVMEGQVTVKFSEDRIITYLPEFLLDLELAYVVTVHKSQGSEFDKVILPICSIYNRMLYRKLVYTALTRAKSLAIFIGEKDSLKRAVDNNEEQPRNSSLGELLKENDEVWLNQIFGED